MKLALHEWLIAVSIALCLATLASLSFLHKHFYDEGLGRPLGPEKVAVYVSGAVLKPTVLLVDRGTAVVDLLSQVQLADDADVTKVRGSSVIDKARKLTVPRKRGSKRLKEASKGAFKGTKGS